MSRITTSPKALKRCFSGCESLLIAMLITIVEVGTHSPWVSRLYLKTSVTRSWLPKRP
jgi:hypothetical protein